MMEPVCEQVEALQLPLVNRFYKQCRYPAKAGRGEEVFVLRLNREIVAALRLSPKAENTFFLRSMCVAPEHRRSGYGRQLLEAIEPVLRPRSVYCFPFDHLESFYGRAGFRLREAAELPSFIRDPWEAYRRQGRKIVIMTRGCSSQT